MYTNMIVAYIYKLGADSNGEGKIWNKLTLLLNFSADLTRT